jgi:hypothetical protein
MKTEYRDENFKLKDHSHACEENSDDTGIFILPKP